MRHNKRENRNDSKFVQMIESNKNLSTSIIFVLYFTVAKLNFSSNFLFIIFGNECMVWSKSHPFCNIGDYRALPTALSGISRLAHSNPAVIVELDNTDNTSFPSLQKWSPARFLALFVVGTTVGIKLVQIGALNYSWRVEILLESDCLFRDRQSSDISKGNSS